MVVVGGGVIGLSIAYYLSQRGVRVTVLDQGRPGQEASWAGAGMLPPGNLELARSAAARLRGFSHRYWPTLSRELLDLTGIDNGYRESGGLELGFDGEQPRMQSEVAEWIAEGVPVEPLTTEELLRYEPALSPEIGCGYHLPGFAQVRNPRHLKALLGACQLRGVRVVAGAAVTGFETSHTGQITAARTVAERYPGGAFVIAGGAWAGGLTRQLGVELPVRPIRGQIVLLSEFPLPFRHVLNHGTRYLVPRADGRILIGSTEEDVGFEKRNTVGGVSGLLQFAEQIVPALGRAKLEQTWSGLRPASPSGNPFLSRLPGRANAYVAAGHFRAGLQLSPGTGNLIAELITTGSTSLKLDEFQIT